MATEEKKRLWDNCQIIGEVQKSEGKKYVVELVARDGIKYINVREWYKKKSESIWRPDRAGIAIPYMQPVQDGERVIYPADDLMKLIKEADGLAPDFEIEDEDNMVWYVPKAKK
jgi:hypothetical protein